MRKLINGIIDFRNNCIAEYRNKFSKLALQQSPDALFIACCDSRVVPNVFASSDPGDLFVLRNIGNIIPEYENETSNDDSVSSAIEFSLFSLDVSDIVICGHSECGAMHSLMENCSSNKCNPNLKSFNTWLKHATPSYTRFKNTPHNNNNGITPCNLLSRINVLQQLDNLKTYPSVKERLGSNKLRIHGWWFDLETANVYCYEQNNDKFSLIDEKQAKMMLSELD